MKVLFVGLGSIGKRHLNNLIHIASRRGIPLEVDALRSSLKPLPPELAAVIKHQYIDFEQLGHYDVAFITNPTSLHASTLADLAGKAEEKVRDTGVSIVMAVVESLAESILYGVIFLISFVGLTVLLKLLIRAVDLVLQLPGLHALNTWGGALVGLVEGALLLFLVVWLLRRFGVSFETDLVADTHILKFFTTHTPLDVLSFL